MISPSNLLFRVYQRAIHSLAFYPTLIALGFVFACLVNISIEYQPWLMSIKETFDVGLVRNADNARLILGTLVGGLVSLMVFSFSMVMVVLNNAAAVLSPRVLPGLVSSKSHQKTLGFYLGTIIYALLLITTIELNGSDKVPSLGVLITLGLGIACLALFVYFIRSISQSIQVEYILSNLYHVTRDVLASRISKMAAQSPAPKWPADHKWQQTLSERSGYFKEINFAMTNELLSEHDLTMTIQVHRGFFVMEGHPLFRLNRKVDDAIINKLLDCFDFFIEEYPSTHYLFGCKQISEIAVKALSPGINDPGTAIKSIDMLSVLFSQRLNLPDFDFSELEDEPPRLFLNELPLDQLLQQIIGPIRTYGAADPSVLVSLLQAFKNLLHQNPKPEHKAQLLRHACSVLESADEHLSTPRDREEINDFIERINSAGKQDLPALSRVKAS
ncbi:DUF2254 domain-containing protein [Pseudomonas sp. EL_65y_Pfl2_R95]|uniref:DUF2254 domain-containing protein n=1 Tax=Pseudomonas sp. EL_65y_Pfl2_R95 TaxID=3088698 RepID=UPI0030DCFDF3